MTCPFLPNFLEYGKIDFCIIIKGSLHPGDTHQETTGGRCCWRLKAIHHRLHKEAARIISAHRPRAPSFHIWLTWQMITNFSTDGRSADSTEIQRVIQYGIYPLKDTGIATRGEGMCLLVVPAIFDPSRFLLLDTEQRHSGYLHSLPQMETSHPLPPHPTPWVREHRKKDLSFLPMC